MKKRSKKQTERKSVQRISEDEIAIEIVKTPTGISKAGGIDIFQVQRPTEDISGIESDLGNNDMMKSDTAENENTASVSDIESGNSVGSEQDTTEGVCVEESAADTIEAEKAEVVKAEEPADLSDHLKTSDDKNGFDKEDQRDDIDDSNLLEDNLGDTKVINITPELEPIVVTSKEKNDIDTIQEITGIDQEALSGSYETKPLSDNHEQETGRKISSKRKLSRRLRMLVIAIEIIVILVEGAVLYVVSKLDRVQKVNISVDELRENISDEVKQNSETGQMKGFTNIALFGVDTRTGQLETSTRSDTILIASINNETKQVKLVSVYRDTYMNLGNNTYNKANAAYSEGGPTQAINMLNMNLDLNITDFITVGFEGLVDVIDALGGIDLELTDAEVGHLNDYQKIMARQQGKQYIAVTQSGMQHLNGLQATAYCRIRYTAGDDFKRTERQRLVLQKVFEEARSASLTELNAIVNAVTDEIYTSFTSSEILSYVSDITAYSIESTDGFPQKEFRQGMTVGRKGSCVVPITLERNVIWLHEYLFGENDYVPSAKVTEYSDKVVGDTGMSIDDNGNIIAVQKSTQYTGNSNSAAAEASEADPYAGLMSMIDPHTGATVWFDPYTGVVIDPASGQPTGALADPANGNVVYPDGVTPPTATPEVTAPAIDPATGASLPAGLPATPVDPATAGTSAVPPVTGTPEVPTVPPADTAPGTVPATPATGTTPNATTGTNTTTTTGNTLIIP